MLQTVWIRPDMGSNCLQMLSADDTSRQRVKCLRFELLAKHENRGSYTSAHVLLNVLTELGEKQ